MLKNCKGFIGDSETIYGQSRTLSGKEVLALEGRAQGLLIIGLSAHTYKPLPPVQALNN